MSRLSKRDEGRLHEATAAIRERVARGGRVVEESLPILQSVLNVPAIIAYDTDSRDEVVCVGGDRALGMPAPDDEMRNAFVRHEALALELFTI